MTRSSVRAVPVREIRVRAKRLRGRAGEASGLARPAVVRYSTQSNVRVTAFFQPL